MQSTANLVSRTEKLSRLRTKRLRRSLRFESLAARELMAGDFSLVTDYNGAGIPVQTALQVVGTTNADSIEIESKTMQKIDFSNTVSVDQGGWGNVGDITANSTKFFWTSNGNLYSANYIGNQLSNVRQVDSKGWEKDFEVNDSTLFWKRGDYGITTDEAEVWMLRYRSKYLTPKRPRPCLPDHQSTPSRAPGASRQ